MGIATGADLQQLSLEELKGRFGSSGEWYWRICRGIDERPVISEHMPKSVGNEETFAYDIFDRQELLLQLLALSEKVAWRLRQLRLSGRTLTLKLRYASFKTLTRSQTLPEPTCYDEEIYQAVKLMLEKLNLQEGVRLLGVTLSNLQTCDGGQISLFAPAPADDKKRKLHAAVDDLRNRYGRGIVTKAPLCKNEERDND